MTPDQIAAELRHARDVEGANSRVAFLALADLVVDMLRRTALHGESGSEDALRRAVEPLEASASKQEDAPTTARREDLRRFDILLTAACALDESTEAPDVQSSLDAIRVARATLTWIAQNLDRQLHADVAAVVVAHLESSTGCDSQRVRSQ